MSLESFYSIFPVPKRMNIEGVGIDLSEVSLRFVRLANKRGKLSLVDFGELDIPEGVISLGRVQKPDALRDILFRLKKEHNIKFVRASLPDSLAYLADMEVSAAKRSEIRDGIELQLEEHVPMTLQDAVFDYDIVDTGSKRAGIFSVAVAAAPKDVSSSYAEVFAAAGLTVLSLETDSSALARAVVKRGSQETIMLLDLGRVKTGVYIVSRGTISFVSDIDIGGKDIQAGIVKEMNVTPEEAKKHFKLLLTGEEPPEDLYNAVSSVYSDLQEEINRHFIYWHTHKDQNGIKKEAITKTLLCGSDATLFGLQDYLAANLKTSVEMANVWENILSFEDTIPKIPFHESFRYSTAIGLALWKRSA